MKKTQISTVTQKGQTTIPAQIRELLNINPGDSIGYIIEGNSVKIRKEEEIDMEWASAVQDTLTEWGGPEDDDL